MKDFKAQVIITGMVFFIFTMFIPPTIIAQEDFK